MKDTWLKIFFDLKQKGKVCFPRGLKVLEIEDYVMNFHPIDDRFCSFNHRRLKLKYLVAELAWYLSGDSDNLMMESYASFWKTVKNDISPFYHSNYGKYFFKEGQFDYVVKTLKEDRDSRQACIILCKKSVMMSNTKDKICTYAIGFRIRDGRLNMSVSMRSSDVIFGLCVDVFQFSVLYEMAYQALRKSYHDLEVGTYVHKSDSLHIYERHFEMLNAILTDDYYNNIQCPRISCSNEVHYLRTVFPSIEEKIRKRIFVEKELEAIDTQQFNFTRWCVMQLLIK